MALKRSWALLVAAGLLAGACGDDGDDAAGTTTTTAGGTPGVVENCSVEVAAADPPERAVTMNQAATEVVLSLGLEDRLAGTAYLDDEILPELADAYEDVPVLAEEYPSREALLDADPDFVYASYASAFGDEAAGSREDLATIDVGSYLSPAACPDFRETGEPLTFDMVVQEVRDIATIFGVTEAGEALIAEQEELVEDAAFDADDEISVLWWDDALEAPSVGACCGAPGMMMTALGLDNVFDDVEGGWAEVNWEEVVEADPDVIVLVDASWSTAADKEAHLRGDAALRDLTAVVEDRLVTIPFSATTPGIRVAPALGELGEAIRALDLDAG
ncbi:MAG: ABC transporter substrate-binding protein [Acidimicrobiia bacterium]